MSAGADPPMDCFKNTRAILIAVRSDRRQRIPRREGHEAGQDVVFRCSQVCRVEEDLRLYYQHVRRVPSPLNRSLAAVEGWMAALRTTHDVELVTDTSELHRRTVVLLPASGAKGQGEDPATSCLKGQAENPATSSRILANLPVASSGNGLYAC